nr:antitoxin VapB family protein [Halorussus amylolyticus]
MRVSNETKRRLELEKREGESFEDVINRLTSANKWSGFGVLADETEDTREGMKRMRGELRSGFERGLDDEECS